MNFLAPKIKAYLMQSGIDHSPTDFQTAQVNDQPEQITHWDAKLGVQPTQAQLDSAWAVKVAAENALAYKAKRAAEYPSFADQFDLLYHGGYDAWKAVIQTVKDKYPKG